MEIYSENLLDAFDIDTDSFARIAAEILSETISPEGEASVVFVSDERIRELNRTYRRIDRPTDVLSFDLRNDPTGRGVIGDVYISVETADRQAAERGIPLEEELLRLLVHGALHLAGHTHDAEENAARMGALEDEYMNRYLDDVTKGRTS